LAAVLLIDFGSTFTKLTAVDLDREEIIGKASAGTTVETDITLGLEEALLRLQGVTGLGPEEFDRKIACSSAAGGLKMVAVGLVPDLTAEAAKRAALGAGARVLSVYAYELTRREIGEIEELGPDIVLLAGGTDGGNSEVILHNARMLARSEVRAPIVVAGNKVCADSVAHILDGAGKEITVTENVMPELGRLHVDPARAAIREVFMEKIVEAKGLSAARRMVDGILMPTPAAVLRASRLLAQGTGDEEGLGDMMVVDVGGATTDVHSLATGEPTKPGIVVRGLAEPYAKRTVEGDLGLRHSAVSLWETAGEEKILEAIGFAGLDIEGMVQELSVRPQSLPVVEEEFLIDQGLARVALEIATTRHVGYIETLHTPFGTTYFQYGKDLTEVKYVIGTGGVFVHCRDPWKLFTGAVFDPVNPTVLKPTDPEFLIDREYVLAHMGLIAYEWPEKAVRMTKKYLLWVED